MRTRSRAALVLVAAASAAAGGATARAAEAGSARQAVSWSLVQAGPNERSLDVSFGYGGCESDPKAEAAESPHGLRITVTVEVPQQRGIVCPAIARIGRMRVALRAPIRGRPLLGSWRVSSPGFGRARTVPRVIGLAAGDARRVVDGWTTSPKLHAAIRVRHGRRGLPRVTSQSPSPGAPAPRGGVVVLHVDAP
jgi:hypothetical protein